MTRFLLTGVLLGLSSGLTPGPLLALVASETLRHGVRAGVRVALAPLITDLPIILTTILLLRPLADHALPLAAIHFAGGVYLAWLGVEGVRFRGEERVAVNSADGLRRGVIANFLNPSPYLFWLTVGAPTVLDAWRHGWPAAAGFVAAFYALLVGSKMLLALALGRARPILRDRNYIALMRGLGALLLVYAGLFLRDGWRLLDGAAPSFP